MRIKSTDDESLVKWLSSLFSISRDNRAATRAAGIRIPTSFNRTRS